MSLDTKDKNYISEMFDQKFDQRFSQAFDKSFKSVREQLDESFWTPYRHLERRFSAQDGHCDRDVERQTQAGASSMSSRTRFPAFIGR